MSGGSLRWFIFFFFNLQFLINVASINILKAKRTNNDAVCYKIHCYLSYMKPLLKKCSNVSISVLDLSLTDLFYGRGFIK